MNEDNKNQLRLSTNRDRLAFFLAVLFVGALTYSAYKYFNIADVKPGAEQELTLSTSTKREPSVVDKVSNIPTPQYETDKIQPAWQANDYKFGDISKGSYTVKSGDTLWEIAEAVYGNGADWVKIATANPSGIGYLPDGQQALIIPGQVLVLP